MISIGMLPDSPLGHIWVAVNDDGLNALKIGGEENDFVSSLRDNDPRHDSEYDGVKKIIAQLEEYFQGHRQQFELDIDWGQLTAFQQTALRYTYQIPFGEVRTYGQIATEIGRSTGAARAVGRAMATNPIPLIIPCHRVVGADGALTGYRELGGIETKAWLLEFEGHAQAKQGRFPW
jgi:methylated-DNA-[protein]-cysteine S-methyltransferase